MLISTNMKNALTESVAVPDGITCTVSGLKLRCAKGSASLERTFQIPGTHASLKDQTLTFTCAKGNKKTRASLLSAAAHIRNMFRGLETPFVYELEICNVHFPMTVKLEGARFVVTNFLGEKEKRVANVLPNVTVDVKGQKVTVSSADLEAAGQTAANLEKATHVSKRDRRVFQDGIFITSKCGNPI